MKPSELAVGIGLEPSKEQAKTLDFLLMFRKEQGAKKATVVVNNNGKAHNKSSNNLSMWESKILKYARAGMTATEIAGKVGGGITNCVVRRVAKKFKVKVRRTTTTVDEVVAGRVLACLETGASDTEVGFEVGISTSVVRLIRLGDHPIVGGTGRRPK